MARLPELWLGRISYAGPSGYPVAESYYVIADEHEAMTRARAGQEVWAIRMTERVRLQPSPSPSNDPEAK